MDALRTDVAYDVDEVGRSRPSVPEVDMVRDTSPLRSSSHVLRNGATHMHSFYRVRSVGARQGARKHSICHVKGGSDAIATISRPARMVSSCCVKLMDGEDDGKGGIGVNGPTHCLRCVHPLSMSFASSRWRCRKTRWAMQF